MREPGPLSRANSAHLVADHYLRGWRLTKNKQKIRNLIQNVFQFQKNLAMKFTTWFLKYYQ